MNSIRPGQLGAWAFWHFVAGAAAGLIPSQLRSGRSIWDMPPRELSFTVGVVVAYWMTAGLITLWIRKKGRVSLPETVAALLMVFGGYALALLVAEAFVSRTIYVGALGLAVLFLALSFWLSPLLQKALSLGLLLLLVGMQAGGARPMEVMNRVLGLEPKPHVTRSLINSHLYSLHALSFVHYFDRCPENGRPCTPPPTGGGLSTFDKGYLLANGDGMLHYFAADTATASFKHSKLSSRIPINSTVYESSVGPNVLNTFRVTDILVLQSGANFELYAAHHFWKVDQKCGVLRLSKAQGDRAKFLSGDQELVWKTVFETTPCLPAKNGHLTRGSESGGRIAQLGGGKLLLTIGDHEYDGVNRSPVAAQDPAVSYGKTVLIDPATSDSRIYSAGHRNPQGLFVDDQGVIWSTEHGPKGGDELNIISEGANYGWPLVTYGTQYGLFTWPLNALQGQHEGFQRPVYAWIPSIAISNLVGVQSEMFPLWRGDLLVASYTKALHRVRVHEGRVVTTESIPIAGRIRDVLQASDGQIVLYLDAGTVIFISPVAGDARSSSASTGGAEPESLRGQRLFASCSGCHNMKDGGTHGLGPDLGGLVGRSVAGAAGYAYSEALRKRGGRWDAETLDVFLADPALFAPGTSMVFAGMPDPKDRAALIKHLSRGGK